MGAGGAVVAPGARVVTAARSGELGASTAKYSEVAVAVDPRRRDESGEAIEQLQRRLQQRAARARARFGALVEQVLGIEFAQPDQGERWPGAVAQQPLALGAISGSDAHGSLEGEAAAVVPMRHCLRVVGREQTAAHEQPQQPPLHLASAPAPG